MFDHIDLTEAHAALDALDVDALVTFLESITADAPAKAGTHGPTVPTTHIAATQHHFQVAVQPRVVTADLIGAAS